MTALELLKKVNEVAREEKAKLTKSFFSGDKSYYKQMLMKYPKCYFNADVYETINNLSATIAHGKEY